MYISFLHYLSGVARRLFTFNQYIVQSVYCSQKGLRIEELMRPFFVLFSAY